MRYDYKCENCDTLKEDVVQSIHDDALTHCDACDTNGLKRIISGGGGFRIGGSGVQKPTSHLIVNTKMGQGK